jgi:hypothetical protein
MSRDNYNNIKKYAAFIFMVFTVLSGSSDRVDADNFARIGKKAFIDILATNKLFGQEIKVSLNESRIKKSEKDHEGFRSLLDINTEDSGPKQVEFYVLPLIVFVYYLNNLILKNSIWKRALF